MLGQLGPQGLIGLGRPEALRRPYAPKQGVRVARLPFGATVIFAGDSHADRGFSISSTIVTSTTRAYGVWGLELARHPFALVNKSNAGISNNTSTQLLARYNTDVVAYAPNIVVLMIGTNDYSAGISSATTISNISSMLSANAAISARTILIKILPRGSAASPMAAGQITDWETVNAWIALQDSSTVTVVDLEPVVGTGDASHTINVAYSPDYLHLNQLGAYLCGKALSPIYSLVGTAGDILFASNNDAGNLYGNGFLTGTAGTVATATGQVADNWIGTGANAGGATVSFQKVARSDGKGEWQQITCGGTYTGSSKLARVYRAVNLTTPAPAGSVVQIACEIEVDASPIGVLTHRLVWAASGNTAQLNVNFGNTGELPTSEAWSGVLRSLPITLPVDPGSSTIQMDTWLVNTAGTDPVSSVVRFGRVQMIRLS